MRRAVAGLTLALALSVNSLAVSAEPPKSESVEVAVYSADEDVGRPFKVVGSVSYRHPGTTELLSLIDAIPDLQSQVRKAGGNGIIIDTSDLSKTSDGKTSLVVTGRAILITP
jgi:hypothetical protein